MVLESYKGSVIFCHEYSAEICSKGAHAHHCRQQYALTFKDVQALHLQPGDKAIMYNIAMIQQKSAEMLFALPPAKRSLSDLQRVIEQASHAQK